MALNMGFGKESITVPAGPSTAQDIVEFGSLRSYPGFMAHFDLKLAPHKQSVLIAEGTFNTRALNRGLDNVLRLSNGDEPTYTDAFFRLNVIGRYKFSDKFDVALKISNLLDASHGGIDVSDGLGNLLYNPQRRRYYFFSINYNY
jgi:outer membrane receptor for ferrienterochelin and colicin